MATGILGAGITGTAASVYNTSVALPEYVKTAEKMFLPEQNTELIEIYKDLEKVSRKPDSLTRNGESGIINDSKVDNEPEKKIVYAKDATGLTEAEYKTVKEKTGWSDEVVSAIRSMSEAEIYINAGLEEMEFEGRKYLMRSDIDMDQVDSSGKTNRERIRKNKSPIAKNGEVVHLHHIGQKNNGPIVELTAKEHTGKGIDSILHDKRKESEIDRRDFRKTKNRYWKYRSKNY